MGMAWMKILIGQYLLCVAFFAYEADYPRALYWLSAAGITTAVLWMGKA